MPEKLDAEVVSSVLNDCFKGLISIVYDADSLSIVLLKQQIEITNSLNERIQNTIYWRLGSVAAFTLLLVGFNRYTNFHFADRDRRVKCAVCS